MKGIVFTEFLELIENEFGLEVVQQIIDECELDTDGIYTSVGTYSHKDMFKMVGKLSEIKGVPVPALLTVFGEYFFTTLKDKYPVFVEKPDLFSFLNSIDQYIHPEVLKLYPDAELPRFDAEIKSDNEMLLNYISSRKMSDLAIGLIKGGSNYFKEDVEIFKVSEEDDGEKVMLRIKKI
ncbi:MAG: heme NO-binding domain-containing protein [Crocinitomicaceae bacterium]|jgi:hypothetical protein|nr:heme NO-binding domain-containing protein [Crocinitomicaceae bacterium]|tara:strand:- start:1087 stop:1623 length:537 start_codon:yes stop_codon:yes gene_type:complete